MPGLALTQEARQQSVRVTPHATDDFSPPTDKPENTFKYVVERLLHRIGTDLTKQPEDIRHTQDVQGGYDLYFDNRRKRTWVRSLAESLAMARQHEVVIPQLPALMRTIWQAERNDVPEIIQTLNQIRAELN